MCKTEKEAYEKYWDDISPFIKYGCLKDTKFCDKMNDYILFKDINDKYQTLPELLVPVEDEKKETDDSKADDAATAESKTDDAAEEKEPERSTIYYVTDKVQQGQYIKMFKEQNMNAVILDHNIDTSFITQLEQRNEHYQFKRIDADVTDALKSDDTAENPHNLQFVELEAAQVARVVNEVEFVVLNGNYALEAGYSVGKDAIAYEANDSIAAKTYVNIIAVKEGNENSDKIKALVSVLRSDEIKKFIEDTYDGAVIFYEK